MEPVLVPHSQQQMIAPKYFNGGKAKLISRSLFISLLRSLS